jgi:hypothetical protein
MPNLAEFNENLVSRLAQKARLSHDDARRFLDGLAAVIQEDEQQNQMVAASPELGMRFFTKYDALPGEIPTHVISIPVVEHEDGTLAIDRSSYSAWTPLKKPVPKVRPKTPRPTPVDPPAPQFAGSCAGSLSGSLRFHQGQ